MADNTNNNGTVTITDSKGISTTTEIPNNNPNYQKSNAIVWDMFTDTNTGMQERVESRNIIEENGGVGGTTIWNGVTYNTNKAVSDGRPYDLSKLINCFIINQVNHDSITFPTVPEELQIQYSPQFNDQEIAGRSAPFITYNNTSAREISLDLTLHRELCKLDEIVNKLKALAYPKYQGSIVRPPWCYVHFGYMLNIYAVCTDISINYNGTLIDVDGSKDIYNSNIDNISMGFSMCEVNIGLKELRLQSIPTMENPLDEGNIYLK